MKIALLFFWFSQLAFAQTSLRDAEIRFQYQDLLDPYTTHACEWKKSTVGLYEYDVTCEVDLVKRVFFVHLVLQWYPKTIHGVSAYELLYWVTDFTSMSKPKNYSMTVWSHNSVTENRLQFLDAALGIDSDLAYLKLQIAWPKP